MDIQELKRRTRLTNPNYDELYRGATIDALVDTLGYNYSTPKELFDLLEEIYKVYAHENQVPSNSDLCTIMEYISCRRAADIITYMRENKDSCRLVPLDLLDAALSTQKMHLCYFMFDKLSVGTELSINHEFVTCFLKTAMRMPKKEGRNVVSFFVSKGIVKEEELENKYRRLLGY